MFQAGLIHLANEGVHDYAVTLYVEGKPYVFCVGNPEKMQDHTRRGVDTGDAMPELFEFDPQDQFAYIVKADSIVSMVTNEVEYADDE